MPVVINEARAHARRFALDIDFAGWPPNGNGELADLWRRVWFTLGALVVYRLSTFLPIPGIDLIALSRFFQQRGWGFLGLIDLLGGGGAHRFSIATVGIAPYISALVIVQLASYVVPRLGGLAIEGPAGRRALNQYARVLTVAIAGLQAIGIAILFRSAPGLIAVPGHTFEAVTVVTLIAGAIFVMWLAEQITERGVGDGAILILACGIATQLPFGLAIALQQVRTGDLGINWLPVTLATVAVIILLVVLVERAVHRISVHDPVRAPGSAGARTGYAPLSLPLNPSGVLAPVAASVFVAPLRGIVAGIGERGSSWLERLANSRMSYVVIEGLLILFFAIVCGLAAFDPDETARKLKESGGWIPGLRPGDNATRYLRLTRAALTLTGALYLITVCVLPDIVYRSLHLPLPFSGFSFFLLAWVMVRILDRMQPFVRRQRP